jgi:hypothetical protein
LLQDEMARVERDITPLVSSDALQKHFKSCAIMQILAGMQLSKRSTPAESNASRIGLQRFASSSKAVSIMPGGR